MAKAAPHAREAEPVAGFAVAPMVLKDEGCAKDYAKSLGLEGIAQRKMFAELVQFGCAQKLTGFFLVRIEKIQFLSDPPRSFAQVYMVNGKNMKEYRGWVLNSAITTGAEMAREYQRLVKTLARIRGQASRSEAKPSEVHEAGR